MPTERPLVALPRTLVCMRRGWRFRRVTLDTENLCRANLHWSREDSWTQRNEGWMR